MAVAVKSSSFATFAASITLPTGIASGDLIIIGVGAYNNTLTTPSGYTQYVSADALGTYPDRQRVYFKISAGSDSGVSVAITGANPDHGGINAVVITGHHPTTPMAGSNFNASTADSTIMSSNSVTPTAKARLFYFWSAMANVAAIPTFTDQGANLTLISTSLGGGTYHRTAMYVNQLESHPANVLVSAGVIGLSQASATSGSVFAVMVGNESPTPTFTSPANYAMVTPVTSTQTFTWTNSDVESNPQYRYEIGYRVRGSATAWTEATVISATTSHTFAANTFTLGTEYEYRLRVDDNMGGGLSPYTAVRYFGAGKGLWQYGPQVVTATQSGVIPKDFIVSGDFESPTAIADRGWESNPAFGAFVQSTVARTITKPETGSYSLEVTMPTGVTIANCTLHGQLVVGQEYLLTARVWVPTGAPNVVADMIYQNNQTVVSSSVKDAWTTVTSRFVNTSSNGNQFPGVKTLTAATAGQKMYIDNFTLIPVYPPVGNYEIQVRTADASDFGPWSTALTFVVRPPANVYTKQAGAFVLGSGRKVRQGGVWIDAPPTKTRSGGVFN